MFVRKIYALDGEGPKSPLATTWRLVGDVLPEDLFPFGSDSGGDFFCVNLTDGSVERYRAEDTLLWNRTGRTWLAVSILELFAAMVTEPPA